LFRESDPGFFRARIRGSDDLSFIGEEAVMCPLVLDKIEHVHVEFDAVRGVFESFPLSSALIRCRHEVDPIRGRGKGAEQHYAMLVKERHVPVLRLGDASQVVDFKSLFHHSMRHLTV
jgi:hypothetical protein